MKTPCGGPYVVYDPKRYKMISFYAGDCTTMAGGSSFKSDTVGGSIIGGLNV